MFMLQVDNKILSPPIYYDCNNIVCDIIVLTIISYVNI